MNLNERFACRVVGQQRSTQRREPASTTPGDPDAALRAWLRDWAKAPRRQGRIPAIGAARAQAGVAKLTLHRWLQPVTGSVLLRPQMEVQAGGVAADPRRAASEGGLQYLVGVCLRATGVSDRRSPGALVHALRHAYATRLPRTAPPHARSWPWLGRASLITSQTYITTAVEQWRRTRPRRDSSRTPRSG